jgi:Domain of unknown function (DUF4352)
MSNQTQQTPQWGQPPDPQPPKQKRQFLVTKIAIGVAAGIALFLVGVLVLISIAIGGNSTGGKQATTGFTAPASTPTDATPDVTSPPASTPASEFVAGDTGSFNSGDGGAADITVTKIEIAKTVDIILGDVELPKHGFYVIAHVKVTGTSGSYDINPIDFYIKSSNGYHTENPEYFDKPGPPLDSGTLHEGEHISGTIIYDAPTKHGKLAYSPNYDGEPLATWSY